jgi:alpha-ketoglutarate-dependent taurine dioxygenase
MKKLLSVKRKAATFSSENLVRVEQFHPDQLLPLVIQPAIEEVNLVKWATTNRDFIEERLLQHGAILFRNFGLHEVTQFEQFVAATSSGAMEYRERSSPRSQVGDRVYTSTDYPPEQRIFPHNEHSYSRHVPLRLFFFCQTPAQHGGETPIGDCRKILEAIDPLIKERFIRKNYMYVRNFGDGLGLPWQTVFQTTDKSVVEAYCTANQIQFEWKENNRLRTYQVRPVIAKHPRSGDLVWFNHATFFNVSTLEPPMRDVLLAQFEPEDLPNNTFYGDGSPIEPQVLDALREAYLGEMVSFPWQQGDLVLLDNMLTAHSRTSFTGARKVLFAMAERYTREDF